jgi:outer membrane lipoprotein SlyB
VGGKVSDGFYVARGMADAVGLHMLKRLCLVAVFATGAVAGCATTSTTTTTTSIPRADLGKTGQVVSVSETVERVQGNPVGGALAGGLIGGVALRGSVVGAAAGAATGAAVSRGSSERRAYEVNVQFDDGTMGQFDYVDYSPFAPGERVTITPRGLARV